LDWDEKFLNVTSEVKWLDLSIGLDDAIPSGLSACILWGRRFGVRCGS
jgi:hypothetical protein